MELSSGRIKDQTQEMAEIEPNRAANLNSTLSKTLKTVRTYTEWSFSMGVCLVAQLVSKKVCATMYHHEVELLVLERCPLRDSWLYKWFRHDQVYFHIFNKSNLGCLLEVWLGSFVGVAAATIPKQQMRLPGVRARWLGIDQFLHFHANTETRLRPTLRAQYLPPCNNLDCDRGVVRGLCRVLVTPLWEKYPSFSFEKEH